MPYTFLLFCKIYAKSKQFSLSQALTLAIPPVMILLTMPTKLNIISIDAYGKNTKTGYIYLALILLLIAYFMWGSIVLYGYYRRTKNSSEKDSLRYIFIGIILTLIPAIIANAILPALGNYQAILYGPNAIIIIALFMSIAIVKHSFLDIRIIVARSAAYVLLFSTIIGLYSLIVFNVATQIFGQNYIADRIIPIAAAIFLAFTIQPLKKFFDRLTNRLFYRDAYDTQVFLDELNNVLVSNIDLDKLLKETTSTLDGNIKSSYSTFLINETSYFRRRVIGSTKKQYADATLGKIIDKISSFPDKIIGADYLDDNDFELKKLLDDNDISLLVRLVPKVAKDTQGVGYILMGPKKSGNVYGKQDIQALEIVANELVIAIQNALRFEEIEKFNITLQDKVNEATAKLRRANEKLKALDETKDDFISMASHQLRTPLTSVKGYLSMVLEGDAGKINKVQREMLGQAFFSSQRMVYLIADLLNVSRLKTGKFVIETAPVDLSEVVEQELGQLEETAGSRSLKLEYEKPKNFPIVMLDETKTRQVIMNFTDNAIYYTPAGGTIKVRLIDNPETIELRVEDSGIGVPKAEQYHLFSKFYRAGNARKARPDGTGLGLFMAKKVILAEGGSVIFESEEGKGSTFGFIFSKSKVGATDKK
jgi:signal transduction histidine kinase